MTICTADGGRTKDMSDEEKKEEENEDPEPSYEYVYCGFSAFAPLPIG